jgi:hypothetical protein
MKTKKFTVNWYYEEEDEDALEIGQHYSRAIRSQFTFIEFKHGEKRILAVPL